MTVKVTAAERRFDAIKTVSERYLNEANSYTINADITREQVSADIAAIAPLGRSERWKTSIAKWARMVEDRENDVTWALVQGSVFAAYAAD